MAKSAAAALHTEPKEPNFLQKFGHDFVHGDIFTKLSFFVWGLGYIGHGQLMKALLVTFVQGFALYFLAFFGVPNLAKFGTLGTVKMEMVFDVATMKNVVNDYDNSFEILLMSMIAFIVIAALIAAAMMVVSSNYQLQKIREAGKKTNNFVQDINVYLNEKFYVTLLTLPVLGVVVFTIVPLFILIADLVPKRLGLLFPEAIAVRVVRPMLVCVTLCRPLVWFFSGLADAIFRLLKIPTRHEDAITSEDIAAVVAAGAEAGVLAAGEHQLIENVFELESRTVASSMTVRESIVWLPLIADSEQVRQTVAANAHSKYLVSDGEIDRVVGYVDSKDLLVRMLNGQSISLKTEPMLRQVLLIPDTLTLSEILSRFKSAREDFAVLLGEFAPGFVCGCRARDRLNQLGNPFLHERVACLWVLNNPGLDPAWCSCWHKLNSQRVQGAIQEHRINDRLHIGVRKGNIDLGHVIGWRRFANARAFHAEIRQVAMPCILDHAQQRTL